MQSTQYYPEATVGTLIFDPAYWQRRHSVFFDYACRIDATEVRLNDEAEA
jgi:hypothetical protein